MNDRQLSRIIFQLESAVAKLAEVVQEEAARADGLEAPDRSVSQRKLRDARLQLELTERVIEELRTEATRELWQSDDSETDK